MEHPTASVSPIQVSRRGVGVISNIGLGDGANAEEEECETSEVEGQWLEPHFVNELNTNDRRSLNQDLGAVVPLKGEVQMMATSQCRMSMVRMHRKCRFVAASLETNRRDCLLVVVGCDRASRTGIANAVPYKGADVT